MKRPRSQSRSRSRDRGDGRRRAGRDSSRDRDRRPRDAPRDEPGRGFRYLADGTRVAADEAPTARPPRPQRAEPRSSFGMLWPPHVDRALFHPTEGCEAIKRNTAEYYDFKDFYAKYEEVRRRKGEARPRFKSREEEDNWRESDVRKAVGLFTAFAEKKKQERREEMARHRANLPITPLRDEIVSLVEGGDALIVQGDTGCGKSTQVPQFLLDKAMKVLVSQPRRIACYGLARRVAEERGEERGSEVGYAVRFVRTASAGTRLVFATEGVVARMLNGDGLDDFDVVIVDEVHERHLQADFLVAALRGIVQRRKSTDKPLKVVLMSATMDAAMWSRYWGNCPVVEVPGRLHPVLIHYRPHPEPDRNLVDPSTVEARLAHPVAQSVPVQRTKFDPAPFLRILGEIEARTPWAERGDLLAFLPGAQEIEALHAAVVEWALQKARERGEDATAPEDPDGAEVGNWIVLELHSALPVERQELAFRPAPQGRRKLVLSTNIAETSVTLPEIRFVIDSGRVREMDYLGGVARLREFWVSRASARQRAGRAGRTGPGECWRLWSEAEEAGMNEWGVPEILRVPLDQVVLDMLALGLGDPSYFEFVERPPPDSIPGALSRLRILGALLPRQNRPDLLTPLGLLLSRLPIHPALGKMLALAAILSRAAGPEVLESVLTVAAGLSVPSPFPRNVDPDARRRRSRIESPDGDLVTLLNLYAGWLDARARGERGWCRRIGAEEQRMYEVTRMREQFAGVLGDAGDDDGADGEDADGGRDGPSNGGGGRKRSRAFRWLRGPGGEEEEEDKEARRTRRMQREALDRQRRMMAAEKPKTLEVGKTGDQDVATDDVTKMSIHDLEFALRYGASAAALQRKADAASVSNLSPSQLNLVKLVFCSGLYPNVAVADEANPQRREGEQAFHTRSKRLVQMHPSGVFASHPDWALPGDAGDPLGEQGTLQALHRRRTLGELLCYQNLVETSGKPYLVNVMKVPSVHAALLFSRSIDTSPDLSRLLVDDWIELKFADPHVAERALVLASWLRTAWDYVVTQSLQGLLASLTPEAAERVARRPPPPPSIAGSAKAKLPPALDRIRDDINQILSWDPAAEDGDEAATADEVAQALADFLDTDLGKGCTVVMARQTEIRALFPRYDFAAMEGDKPGIPVTPFLRYGSLPALGSANFYSLPPPNMAAYYRCGYCGGFEGVVTREQVDEHLGACVEYNGVVKVPRAPRKSKDELAKEQADAAVEEARRKDEERRRAITGGANWACDRCGEVLRQGTPVEILKHKRSCVGRVGLPDAEANGSLS
ncbi:P-loop containing nucleoside triphosphate hydrolase protein [Hyaloraphidium curvatum]|nr:P-loop containing nucleoside triphosphate hydrolase protein [Hyaloraphidium curvatum]